MRRAAHAAMKSPKSATSEPLAGGIAGTDFNPGMLTAAPRPRGVSAFMRIRNGEAFLEPAIRSHIRHFDEIVAVHNRCTDRTPDILARLAQEFGPKLRVFQYLPDVYPPGSDGHKREPANSPNSLVNYYNVALALTRFSHATKLDDDHLAIESNLASLVADASRGRHGDEMSCFSGFNLARAGHGGLGILASDPFSGGGDIGIFPVSSQTYFTHDPRFERFHRGPLRRRFRGFVYWHLKYLKADRGFANYDLAENPESRYRRKLDMLEAGMRVVPASELEAGMDFSSRVLAGLGRLGVPLPQKARLVADRWNSAIEELARHPLDRVAGLPDPF